MGTASTGESVTTSLDELFRREYAPMVRLATLLVGSDAVAEELVQDAFVAVHRRSSSVDNPGGYLRTSVVNACRSHQRRAALERRRLPRPDQPDLPPVVADMRRQIVEAAVSCDYERLAELTRQSPFFSFSFGTVDSEPATFWQEAEEQEERPGGSGYLGYRVGITAEGDWIYFIAGD
ncbi:hypothetical protein BH20ACT1_BH20ACT1_06640 [soil metagenome]